MVKINQGDVKMTGDLESVMSEVSIAVRCMYEKLLDIHEGLADEWLDSLPAMTRITEAEMLDAYYERMWEE